jgi:anthranilate synthase component I
VRIKPTFAQFLKLSRKGNLIPVYAESLADLETPVSCFLKMGRHHQGFLLESVEGASTEGRFSFLGTKPSFILDSSTFKGNPLDVLKRKLKRYHFVPSPDLPRFCGGAVGYMSYETNRLFEKLPPPKKSPLKVPDCFIMIADTLLVFDHHRRKIIIVSCAFLGSKTTLQGKRKAYNAAIQKIMKLNSVLKEDVLTNTLPPHSGLRSGSSVLRSNFTKKTFEKAVNRIKRHIRHGNVIQAVLSQRFERTLKCDPFDVYRALRSLNPSPYMFYLNCGSFKIVGSSPEVHVRCEDGELTLNPIAGTRPRGSTDSKDKALEKELLSCSKERAEHVMLVDLGRNDLGRVAVTGSVKVHDFMTVERYSHVMHIVSRIRGLLDPRKDIYDVIRATFPAGTVSGAPKVRAMQIIQELEPNRRGPYAGLVGYFSFSHNLDSCITIRTMIIQDGKAYVQAGAGIVADSNPHHEWLETKNKAAGLLKAIDIAEKGL